MLVNKHIVVPVYVYGEICAPKVAIKHLERALVPHFNIKFIEGVRERLKKNVMIAFSLIIGAIYYDCMCVCGINVHVQACHIGSSCMLSACACVYQPMCLLVAGQLSLACFARSIISSFASGKIAN